STRRNMLAHAKALETLMGFGPVLPMRFGMIAPTEAQIAQAIDLKQDALLEHLASVEGCAEYGVTIAWERAEAMREVVAATPALKTAYERLAGRSAAETHFDRLELGRRVEGALFSKRIEEAAKLTERLAPLAREIAEREPEEDIQVLKADLLIKQDRAAALSALLEEIEAEAPGRLRIKLVGPSPAYAFSKLTLGWGDAAPSRAGGQGGPAAWVS
ncbi:MAG: GvpL/GvpF family gas vesicle protein, partial [Pseudomonadota bacterium]